MFKSILWDVYAWSYDSGVNSLDAYSDLMHAVIQKLTFNKDDIILDLGCGTGNLETAILTHNKPFKKIIALDISNSMLKRAREKGYSQEIYFQQHNLDEKLPLEDASIDKAIMIHALYAVKDPNYTLKEIHRVLKKDGILVVANPYDENGGKKIKEQVFSGMSPLRTIYTFLLKLPVISINMIIGKMAKSKKYHFIKEKKMSTLLDKNGFKVPKCYEEAYAGTDILFKTHKK